MCFEAAAQKKKEKLHSECGGVGSRTEKKSAESASAGVFVMSPVYQEHLKGTDVIGWT